jgi:hypothetical protein
MGQREREFSAARAELRQREAVAAAQAEVFADAPSSLTAYCLARTLLRARLQVYHRAERRVDAATRALEAAQAEAWNAREAWFEAEAHVLRAVALVKEAAGVYERAREFIQQWDNERKSRCIDE